MEYRSQLFERSSVPVLDRERERSGGTIRRKKCSVLPSLICHTKKQSTQMKRTIAGLNDVYWWLCRQLPAEIVMHIFKSFSFCYDVSQYPNSDIEIARSRPIWIRTTYYTLPVPIYEIIFPVDGSMSVHGIHLTPYDVINYNHYIAVCQPSLRHGPWEMWAVPSDDAAEKDRVAKQAHELLTLYGYHVRHNVLEWYGLLRMGVLPRPPRLMHITTSSKFKFRNKNISVIYGGTRVVVTVEVFRERFLYLVNRPNLPVAFGMTMIRTNDVFQLFLKGKWTS
jgi:hypothetical protein